MEEDILVDEELVSEDNEVVLIFEIVLCLCLLSYVVFF